jgi:hypothetical protein
MIDVVVIHDGFYQIFAQKLGQKLICLFYLQQEVFNSFLIMRNDCCTTLTTFFQINH